jgi:hypothetical protein
MSNITASEVQAPPAVPARPLRDLRALALMLADGWRIEAPVLARLSWAQRRTGELAYHVIVTRASQRSLIVIAEDPKLHRFLAEHAIPVI